MTLPATDIQVRQNRVVNFQSPIGAIQCRVGIFNTLFGAGLVRLNFPSHLCRT